MNARVSCFLLLSLLSLSSALACSFDSGANASHGCGEQCAICHLGYCLATIEQGQMGAGSGAASGAAGNGSGGMTAVNTGGSAGVGGVGGAGVGGAGVGGVGGAGAGGVGGDPGCGSGMSAGPETCNGLDDDCNGAIDDGISLRCYPEGAAGCAMQADGSFACEGLCTTGTQTCDGGVLSACSGAVTPAEEVCGGDEAADESCDGTIDDGCTCEGNETQRCYSGPRFSAGIGECRAGQQTCESGTFGPCEGEVTPQAETCANLGADDNCNFTADDVPNLNGVCFDFTQQGVCFYGRYQCQGGALVCNTPSPEDDETSCDNLDEDCDGDVDEGFVLGSDEDNCGMCGMRCPEGDLCCNGQCKDVDSDPMHCGECNETCNGLACCSGDCVDTQTVDYCGSCEIACGPSQDCCEGHGCTDLDTVEHCGDCDTACGEGQGCCEGHGCTDLDTVEHCGDCDTACGEDEQCCNGGCVNPAQAPCGACGTACPEPCTCNGVDCVDNSGAACL